MTTMTERERLVHWLDKCPAGALSSRGADGKPSRTNVVWRWLEGEIDELPEPMREYVASPEPVQHLHGLGETEGLTAR